MIRKIYFSFRFEKVRKTFNCQKTTAKCEDCSHTCFMATDQSRFNRSNWAFHTLTEILGKYIYLCVSNEKSNKIN